LGIDEIVPTNAPSTKAIVEDARPFAWFEKLHCAAGEPGAERGRFEWSVPRNLRGGCSGEHVAGKPTGSRKIARVLLTLF